MNEGFNRIMHTKDMIFILQNHTLLFENYELCCVTVKALKKIVEGEWTEETQGRINTILVALLEIIQFAVTDGMALLIEANDASDKVKKGEIQ